MTPKDYYTTLGIPVGSSPEAVKKAYRGLVMRYHPDKNPGNAYAAAHFQEVQEAYDVLSDPLRREDYHQQRSLWKATGKAFENASPLTPDQVLRQAIRLDENVRAMDRYRMDREGIAHTITRLLHDTFRLDDFREPSVCAQIAHFLLRAADPLPLRMVVPFRESLLRLAAGDEAVLGEIVIFYKRKKLEQYVSRYQTLLLVIVAFALCYLAYRLSH